MYDIKDKKRFRDTEYFVTTDGKIIRNDRILKPSINNAGYYSLTICHKGSKKMMMIHRIIAETYITNQFNKLEVNHIDGNKLNNHIDNLEWVSSSENKKHAYTHNLMNALKGEKSKLSKLTEIDIKWIRDNYKKGVKGFGYISLSKKFNCHKSTIEDIIKYKTWKHI
jgi:hypothetical protein